MCLIPKVAINTPTKFIGQKKVSLEVCFFLMKIYYWNNSLHNFFWKSSLHSTLDPFEGLLINLCWSANCPFTLSPKKKKKTEKKRKEEKKRKITNSPFFWLAVAIHHWLPPPVVGDYCSPLMPLSKITRLYIELLIQSAWGTLKYREPVLLKTFYAKLLLVMKLFSMVWREP